MVLNFLFVAAGGAIGSALRYTISLAIGDAKLPIATFFINFVGSLIIGVAAGAIAKHSAGYFLAVIGFCGGFTTFSTFSLEVVNMIRNGSHGSALIYIVLSVIFCVGGTFLGLKISE